MSGYAQSHITTAPRYSASIKRVKEQSASSGAIPYTFVLVFLVLLYSQLPMLVPALDGLRLVYVIGGGGLIALIAQRASEVRGLDFVWPESALMVALVLAAALSCIGALWLRSAFENTLDLAKMVTLYFLVTNSVKTAARLRRTIWVMVLGGLFPAIGTLLRYMQGQLVEGRASWLGIFANPNELAYALTILVPLAVYLASTSGFFKSLFVWGIVGIYVAATFVTYSRGGMLSLLIVFGLLAFRSKAAFPRLLLGAGLVLSVAFMLRGWSRSEGFTNLSEDTNVHTRILSIKGGLAMFADHPLTGVGLGGSIIAWPLYAPPDIRERWLIIHNTFVQVLSETGLPGFAAFMLLLGVAIYDARRMQRQSLAAGNSKAAQLALCLELSMWGFAACGMSGGFLITWFPYLLIGLVAATKEILKGDPAAGTEL
jgi:putative inorganic carbon (hco3(-)) transporter